MTQVPMEELLRRCPSAYRLTILASKRAKELSEGAPKLVQTDLRKVTSIALEEVRQGKIAYAKTEEETAKAETPHRKKRKSLATESKKKRA